MLESITVRRDMWQDLPPASPKLGNSSNPLEHRPLLPAATLPAANLPAGLFPSVPFGQLGFSF